MGFISKLFHRQMYNAKCSRCGAPFELPFKPTGKIYCKSCTEEKIAESAKQKTLAKIAKRK